MSRARDLDRAVAFLRVCALRRAQRVIGAPTGFVVLDERYRASYDHNKLIVCGRPDPAEILRAADELLGVEGLRHRLVIVEDDDHGRVCSATLGQAGYQHSIDLVMRYSGATVPSAATAISGTLDGGGPAGIDVEQVAPEELYELDTRLWRDRLPRADDDTIRQLVERRTTLARGAEQVSFLAVRDRTGAVLSRGDLYLEPATGIAQIEDLGTDAAHGRRGYAGAVVAEALRRARAAGCERIFLVADGQDWPQHWYGRIGFAAVGAFHTFTRPGP